MKTHVRWKKRLIFLQQGFVSWQGVGDGSLARRQAGEIRAGQACVLWYKCCLYPWQLHQGRVTWLPDRAVVLDKNVHWFSTFSRVSGSFGLEGKVSQMVAVILGFLWFIGWSTFYCRWNQIILLYREHGHPFLTPGWHRSPSFKGHKNDSGLK